MSKNAPLPATVEDCNSGSENDVVRSISPPKKPSPNSGSKRSSLKERVLKLPSNHSDSGYSSRTGATLGSMDSRNSTSRPPSVPKKDSSVGKKVKANEKLVEKVQKSGPTRDSSSSRKEKSAKAIQVSNPNQSKGCPHPGCQHTAESHRAAPACPADPHWNAPYAPQPTSYGHIQPAHGYSGPPPTPQPRARPASMARARPASYHPGMAPGAAFGDWSDISSTIAQRPSPNSSTYTTNTVTPQSQYYHVPVRPQIHSYATASHSTVVPGPAPQPPQRRPSVTSHYNLQARPMSIVGSVPRSSYDVTPPQYDTGYNRPVGPGRSTSSSCFEPHTYPGPVDIDRALMPPPALKRSQPPYITHPSRSGTRAPSARRQVAPGYEYGYEDVVSNQMMLPPRHSSLESDLYRRYPGDPPTAVPSLERSTSRSSGQSSFALHEVSRAELVKSREREAEAYMGRVSGQTSKSNPKNTNLNGAGDSSNRKSKAQPLTAKALEKKSKPRGEPPSSHSRSFSYSTSNKSHASHDGGLSRTSTTGDNMSTASAGGAVKIRIPSKERFDLEFSGGMDTHKVSFGPDGTAELIFGSPTESTKSFRGSLPERSTK